MKLGKFNAPAITTITSRSSSIRAAFVKAIIPTIFPKDKTELNKLIEENLNHLPHTNNGELCAYCCNKATEWDHFRSVIVDKKPSGFCTDIYNLVPSCGKCNQSKGSKCWLKWIISKAKLSPKSREIQNLNEIILNIQSFEKWSSKYTHKLTNKEVEKVENYLENCEKYIDQMKIFQEQAKEFQNEFKKNTILKK